MSQAPVIEADSVGRGRAQALQNRASGPRRVLLVAHSAHRGGAEYCLDTTLEHIDQSRFAATVLFPGDGPMCESARRRGCEVLTLSLCHWMYFERDWWYWKHLAGRALPNVVQLAQLMRRRSIDLVYTNTSAIFEPALAARLARIPHIWHVHEVLKNGDKIDQLLPLATIKGLIHRLSDRVIFESHAARRVFEKTTPEANSVVIHNGVRSLGRCPEGEAHRERSAFGLRAGDEVVVFVGQLIDRKNPLLLVEAIRLLGHRPQLKCLFAGEGPLRSDLEAAIARQALEGRCRILGFQADVMPVLRVADVVVLPSRQESFGLVLLEAASQSKPVIATESEGPSEIIMPGDTGLLVLQDDAKALAGAIESMFNGTIDRQAMGIAAARHVAANFGAEPNTRRLEAVFEEVLAQRGTGRV